MIGERRKVLTMLHDRKIDVDEAEGLLDALEHVSGTAPEPEIEIVTADPQLQEVLDYARKAARSDMPVLIVGEAGTGKELVGRMIHQHSNRRDKKFIVISCAALSGVLLESEIFGHAPRAFTGAHRLKPGFVSLADGGTLFLDSIDQLTMELQVKLLRYIEAGEFRRVGGTEVIQTDVRIIGVTDKDLRAAVQTNRFRGDLFDRLSFALVEIPPLRSRIADISLLADYFLKKHAERIDRVTPSIAPELMDLLTAYPWPGNVRELEKVIAGALILCDGDTIQVSHLSETLIGNGSSG